MSAAVVLAGCAGLLAAAGILDLAVAHAAARRPRLRRRRLHRTLVALGRRVAPAAVAPADLALRAAAAGTRLPPAELMTIKAGAAVAGLLLAVPLAPMLPGRLGWIAPAAAALAGFLGPDVQLGRMARRRAAAIARELPDVADLLRVAVDAGLPIRRALAEVARRHDGVIAGELRRAVDALALGAARPQVLGALKVRAGEPGLIAMLDCLDRAEQLGTPPGEALRAIASRARTDRARATAEAAARAAPQIQLVVALLLVPSVMLLVAAALVPALTR